MGYVRAGNLIFFVGLLLTLGCAQTSITSFKEPSYSKKPLTKILVAAVFQSLDERRLLEQAVSANLSKEGVVGVPSITLILPTRTYTNQQINELLMENDIDGVLLIRVTEKERVITSRTYNTLNVFEKRWETTTRVLSLPRIYCHLQLLMQLLNVRTGQTIWVATTQTGVGFPASRVTPGTTTLLDSLADTIVKKLEEDAIL